MIRRRHAQRSLGDVVLFGACVPDPELLMDPVLRKVDRLLDDDALIDAVFERQRKRYAKSGQRGRRGTPAEVVLRMLALKQLRGWSFEELEWEVKGNLCYRRFCRIDAGKVPDATTMVRQAQLFDATTLRAMLDRGIAQAKDNGVTSGQKMRVDTTVVEANIHHPTDSGLCEDSIRALSRAVRRLEATGVKLKSGFRNVSRSVQRRLHEIAQAVRLRGEKAKSAIKRPYRRLLRITGRILRQAERAAKQAKRKLGSMQDTQRKSAQRALEQIRQMAPRARQVLKQTRARVLHGVTTSADKLISVFEPHAQILRRGKPHKPTEFGMLVKVQESDGGIVTDIALVPGKADAPLLVPSVERHQRLFGHVPKLVATDRGFYSGEGERQIIALGVKRAVIPKPGGKSKQRIAHEQQRWFRRGRAWRAGGEARISRLKHRFGMARSRARGQAGMQRTILWAALANNWVAVARHG